MLLSDWAEIARDVMEHKPYAAVLFLAFVSISGFIVFNLIIAVVCDAVHEVGQETKEEEMKEEVLRMGGLVPMNDADKLLDTKDRLRYLLSLADESCTLQQRMASVSRKLKSMSMTQKLSVSITEDHEDLLSTRWKLKIRAHQAVAAAKTLAENEAHAAYLAASKQEKEGRRVSLSDLNTSIPSLSRALPNKRTTIKDSII
jgi:hypothetical protein